MASIALFHSVYGLTLAERATAARWTGVGHIVRTPDLFDGRVATDLEDGFSIADQIGWNELVRRASVAVEDLPPDAVLAGLSMGTDIVAELLKHRPSAAAIVLLHRPATLSEPLRPGLPVQLQIAEPDPFVVSGDVASWSASVTRAGARPEVFTYPGVGHLYTASDRPDYDRAAADLTWERSVAFLAHVRGPFASEL